MKINVKKTITIELEPEESSMFSVTLKIALRGLKDLKNISQDRQFQLVNEEVQSYDEMQGFIEDLMRGIQ